MTDRELLELAAKAAGIVIRDSTRWKNTVVCQVTLDDGSTNYVRWNPITDSGQALELAVKLRLPIRDGLNGTVETGNERSGRPIWELWGDDPYAATRRAIVRAAAEIGKGMK